MTVDEGVEIGDDLEAFARLGVERGESTDQFLHLRRPWVVSCDSP
jgi:hypothetical protein